MLLPGELLRLIKSKSREPENVYVRMRDTGDESDAHRAMLWYRGEEVCAMPCGPVPRRSTFDYVCERCGTQDPRPFSCHGGAPPTGMGRRGVHLMREATGQGHVVYQRLKRRGADAILEACRGFRDECGRRLLREGA